MIAFLTFHRRNISLSYLILYIPQAPLEKRKKKYKPFITFKFNPKICEKLERLGWLAEVSNFRRPTQLNL